MYKSAVVKLVLLNSVLAFSACARTPCEPEEVKKDGQQLAENKDGKPRRTCHGGSYRHGGGHFIYVGGGGGTRGGRAGQPGSGTVGRGGFGATGHGTAT